MDYTIREADLRDVQALADLTGQLGYPCTSEEAEASLKDIRSNSRDFVLVAELASMEVVGWVHLSFATSFSTGPFAVIVGLVVDSGHRSLGLGKALVQEAVRLVASLGVLKVRVRSKSTRFEAHRFYRGLGFEEEKEQKVFDLKL